MIPGVSFNGINDFACWRQRVQRARNLWTDCVLKIMKIEKNEIKVMSS